jgi:hypothetical protein
MNTILSPSRHVELPNGCFFRLHDLLAYFETPTYAPVLSWVKDWVASQPHPVVAMLHAPDDAFCPLAYNTSLIIYAKTTYVSSKDLKLDMLNEFELFNWKELEAKVTQHWVIE